MGGKRADLERQLDQTREGVDDEQRERLFSEVSKIEQLILSTPSGDLPALCAKARLLSWYMDMEQADGAPAIHHIRDFLEGLKSAAVYR